MRVHPLSSFALVTGVLVLIAVLLARQDAAPGRQEKGLLFPGIAEGINKLAAINIQSAGQSLSLIKQDGQWRIGEADHYPADFARIRQTAIAASDLRILAEKTSNPALYEKLGVEDPFSEGAGSVLLSFRDEEKNSLLGLIVGNTRPARLPGGKPGLYVRLPGSGPALLVEGALALSVDAGDWLARELLDIGPERIRSVQIQHGDDPAISIQRDSKEDAFRLQDPPAGRTVDAVAVSRLSSLLENIYIDDVRAEHEQFAAAAGVVTTVRTFDGLVAEIASAEADGRRYSKFRFAYEEPAREKDNQTDDEAGATAQTSSAPDVSVEAERLNRLVSGWLYEIPDYKFELFTSRRQALLEEREDEDSDGSE